MPELPEVETVRRGLIPYVLGSTIQRAMVHRGFGRMIKDSSVKAFRETVEGNRIEELRRHGKYLIFRLSNGRSWIVHLRMTGAFLISAGHHPRDRYERARVEITSPSYAPEVVLVFNDVRRFGTWECVPTERETDRIPRGPDALAIHFTQDDLLGKLRSKHTSLKSALLDQAVVAGLGNIYVDEACFLAGIRPDRKTKNLSAQEVQRLYCAIGTTLNRALEQGGTSFRNYVDAFGIPGGALSHCQVYQRDGECCRMCDSTILKIKHAGRGTHYCPVCQD